MTQLPSRPHTSLGGSSLVGRTVVLIGGGSGIGLRVAHHAVAAGAHVVLGGRTEDRLARAADELGGGDAVRWRTVDVTDEESLAALFAEVDRVDHLFTTAATYRVGPLRELDARDAESPFTSKFWGQYHAVRHAAPKLSGDASVVLMAGAAGARPPGPAPAYAACNAAIEGLGRGLAVELAPVRVNVVSPGTVDGHLWAGRPAADRDAAFAQYERDTVLHRTGTEDEIAHAVLFLFTNGYTTGSTLYPDGGYTFR
ncbi:SDR family oxidoreductase [Streptomyces sp. NPDC090106]|uniref:SDR family oxidoreductase n=1 Tax=Streptomyces sp. NPDC090106 TaxID=3365946 RepID=UPI00382C35B6